MSESNGGNNSAKHHGKDGHKLIGIWLSETQIEMLADIGTQYRSPNRTHTLRLMIEDTHRKVMKGSDKR